MTDEQYEMLNRMIPDERLYVLAGGVDDPYGCDIEAVSYTHLFASSSR